MTHLEGTCHCNAVLLQALVQLYPALELEHVLVAEVVQQVQPCVVDLSLGFNLAQSFAVGRLGMEMGFALAAGHKNLDGFVAENMGEFFKEGPVEIDPELVLK